MPARTTQRNLAGNERIELHGQREDFAAASDAIRELEVAFDKCVHHVMRRLAEGNQKRRAAIKELDTLQAEESTVLSESTWDARSVAA